MQFNIDKILNDPLFEKSCFGINWNLNECMPPELKEPYCSFKSKFESALQDAGIFVYPFEHAHITLANIVPFTDQKLNAEEQSRMMDIWTTVIAEIVEKNRSLLESADIVLSYDSIDISPNACFFRITEVGSSVVDTLRRQVREAFVAHPLLASLDADVKSRTSFRTPNIIHSTLFRFKEPSKLSPEEITHRWKSVADTWTPVKVHVRELLLVKEKKPYMQVDLYGEDKECVLHQFRK
jgi:hypothetical protein